MSHDQPSLEEGTTRWLTRNMGVGPEAPELTKEKVGQANHPCPRNSAALEEQLTQETHTYHHHTNRANLNPTKAIRHRNKRHSPETKLIP